LAARPRFGYEEVVAVPPAARDALGAGHSARDGGAWFRARVSFQATSSKAGRRGQYQEHRKETCGIGQTHARNETACARANTKGSGENRRTRPATSKNFTDQKRCVERH